MGTKNFYWHLKPLNFLKLKFLNYRVEPKASTSLFRLSSPVIRFLIVTQDTVVYEGGGISGGDYLWERHHHCIWGGVSPAHPAPCALPEKHPTLWKSRLCFSRPDLPLRVGLHSLVLLNPLTYTHNLSEEKGQNSDFAYSSFPWQRYQRQS